MDSESLVISGRVEGEYIEFSGGKSRALGNKDAGGFIGYPAGRRVKVDYGIRILSEGTNRYEANRRIWDIKDIT
jgi:hypothetical protein